MSTTKATTENGIDNRMRRVVEGCMVVVPEGDASGRFDVYSANDGHNEIYTVDLRTATCECGDYEHRNPAGGCKHIRRVKLGLGIIPLPVGIDPDGCLIDTRTKYGVDVDEAACTSVSDAHTLDSGGRKAVADGGQLIEAPDDGVILDDDADGDEKEKEKDTDEECELRSAAHTIALDAYEARPLPDFDVFGEIVTCSADSVRRALETEASR